MSQASLKQLDRRQRVIYKSNPLVEVIAAVRYPPILALIQEPPSEFQRAFAEQYPLSEVNQTISISAMVNSPAGSNPPTPIAQRSYRCP